MLIALFASIGFLASWVGVAVLLLYFVVVSAFFEDDWWIRGVLFLALPIAIAFGLGVIGLPSLTQAAWLAGGYLFTGVMWSFFRWAIFVHDLKKVLNAVIRPGNWDAHDTAARGIHLWREISAKKDYSGYYFSTHLDERNARAGIFIPNVSNWHCKARLGSWMIYWPFSVMNYVYSRLLKDLVDFIVERMKGVYNLIAVNIMKGLEV